MSLDTADGIANELITAGLVDAKDFTPMAQNLQRLIQERAKIKNVVFQLVCFCVYYFFKNVLLIIFILFLLAALGRQE